MDEDEEEQQQHSVTHRDILTTDQSDAGSAGIISRRTNQTQEARMQSVRVYSHDGPITHHLAASARKKSALAYAPARSAMRASAAASPYITALMVGRQPSSPEGGCKGGTEGVRGQYVHHRVDGRPAAAQPWIHTLWG
eukprot:4304564-Pyramimonas_sp.AAC.1